MNRNRILRYISMVAVIVGILTAFYPFVQDFYQQYRQKRLLEEFQNQALAEEPGAESVDFMKAMTENPDSGSESDSAESGSGSDKGENGKDSEGDVAWRNPSVREDGMSVPTHAFEPTTELSTDPPTTVDIDTDLTVIGTIKIPKVEIELPIMKYSTQFQLDYGAVHVAGTTPIGEIGNCGIAAHRGRNRWRFFHRINELIAGDSIFIEYNNQVYEYIVYESLVVLPDQVEVLNRSRTKKLLTLITCDPPGSDKYRLIIHAILK